MEKHHLPHSISVYNVKLHCKPCAESIKESLLKRIGIVEVDTDLEKSMVKIKGNINIANLLTMFQKLDTDADLIYYKKQGWVDRDEQTESCDEKENDCFHAFDEDEVEDIGATDQEKCNMFKHCGQRKESRGKKGKKGSFDDDEAEDIGADHYKIHNTFKDHKPEKYAPPKKEYFWGDFRSGMHKKFPSIPGVGSRFTAGFPNYHGLYYPAPWPQEDYYM